MLCTQSFYQEFYFKSVDIISSECVYLVISFCYGVFIDFSGQTLDYYQLLCLLQARNTGAVDISWLASTAIVSVQGAGKKVKALTLVSPILTVTHVIH